jgi:predicted Zn-dependent protease
MPETTAAILESAQTYVRQGQPETAETILAKACEQYPTDQSVRVAYADVLLARSKAGEAYQQYEKALAIGPREHVLEFTAGNVASMAGLPDRALEHFSAAQAGEPTNAKYALYLGQVQLKIGQLDAGKATVLRAVTLDPDLAVGWGSLADAAIRENNAHLALQHIEKARKLEPSVVTWRLIESRALRRIGKPGDAVEVLIGLPDADRFQLPVLKQIGECYGMLNRPGDAAAVFAKASDAQPKDAVLALAAAEWMERAGEKDRAYELAKRAAEHGDAKGAEMLKRFSKTP